MNYDFSKKIDGLPSELLGRWSKLAYVQITSGNLFQLDEVIQLVEHPMLPVCHKEQMLRVLKSLRATGPYDSGSRGKSCQNTSVAEVWDVGRRSIQVRSRPSGLGVPWGI